MPEGVHLAYRSEAAALTAGRFRILDGQPTTSLSFYLQPYFQPFSAKAAMVPPTTTGTLFDLCVLQYPVVYREYVSFVGASNAIP